MDGILESPELKQTIKELPNLVSTLRHTLNTVDREVAGPSHGGSTFFEVPLEAATAPGVAAATADALGDVFPMGSRRRPTARATIWQVETAHCLSVTSKWMKSDPDS